MHFLFIGMKEGCLFCDFAGRQLKTHLLARSDCRLKYIEHFDLHHEVITENEKVNKVMTKIKNHRRKKYASRQKKNRQLEKKTSLFNFWRSTEIGPATYPCVECFTVDKKETMVVVKGVYQYRLEREGNYYRCKKCSEGAIIEEKEPIFSTKSLVIDYVETVIQDINDEKQVQPPTAELTNNLLGVLLPPTIFLPSPSTSLPGHRAGRNSARISMSTSPGELLETPLGEADSPTIFLPSPSTTLPGHRAGRNSARISMSTSPGELLETPLGEVDSPTIFLSSPSTTLPGHRAGRNSARIGMSTSPGELLETPLGEVDSPPISTDRIESNAGRSCSGNQQFQECDPISVCGAMLPSSIDALSHVALKREPLKQKDSFKNIYDVNPIRYIDHYPSIYEAEIKKYMDVKNYGGVNFMKYGKITNENKKEVSIMAPRLDVTKIRGSDDFYKRCQDDFMLGIRQAGQLFLCTELSVPHFSLAVIATQLLVNGSSTIDVHHDGSEENPKISRYSIHGDHFRNENCSEECQPSDLGDFLSDMENSTERISLGTISNYTSTFFKKFIGLVIKDPSSDLSPSYFDANIKFPIGNVSKIIIATWPQELVNLNKKIAFQETLSKGDLRKYLEFAERNLTTSTSVIELQYGFNLTEELAEVCAELAEKYQKVSELERLSQMPSSITMIKKRPIEEDFPVIDTDKAYKLFRSEMERHLVEMSDYDLKVTDVESWLYRLEDEEEVELIKIEDSFLINFANGQSVIIPNELELSRLINENCFSLFEGIYHRSLSFSKTTNLEIVHKCRLLFSAFIAPYHPTSLLANHNKCITNIIASEHLEVVKKLKGGEDDPIIEEGNPYEQFGNTHKVVSCLSSVWRVDGSNMTSRFINSN